MCYEWGMDGAWTGFAWSMGTWHQNITPQTLHVLVGDMFQGSSYASIETCVRPPT